jgi:hypothetical protein
MSDDMRGTRHDAETEAVDEVILRAHLDGECPGPPKCGYCMDDQNRGDEALGG